MRTRHLEVAEPVHQSCDRVVRLRFILLPNQLGVCASVGARRRVVAERGERFHIRRGESRVGRVEARKAAPVFRGFLELSRFGRLFGDDFDGANAFGGERSALQLGPALELWSVGEVKPVEERSGIELGGSCPIFRRERRTEFLDVAPDSRGIESQRGRGKHDVAAHVTPEIVQSLRECVASTILIGLGPEHGHDTLTRDPRRVRCGEDREQRQRTRALSRIGRGHWPLDSQPAESPEPQGFKDW